MEFFAGVEIVGAVMFAMLSGTLGGYLMARALTIDPLERFRTLFVND